MAKRVIDDATLTAVAEGIRKDTRQTAKITPENMPYALSEIDTSAYSRTLPDYWDKPVADAIATINALGTDYIPISAIFTDVHYHSGVRYTGALAAKVMDRCGIPFAMCLGDLFSQQGHTVQTEEEVIANYIDTNRITSPIGWYRYLPTQGNHDGSYGGVLSSNGKDYDRTYIYQTPQSKLNKWIYNKSRI